MVLKSNIPKYRILIFFFVSLACSVSIFLNYFIWPVINPGYEHSDTNIHLYVSLILAIFSFLASVLILLLKEIKPLYIPTGVWVGILIIYALVSGIYIIILPALVQLITDIWFYKKLENIE